MFNFFKRSPKQVDRDLSFLGADMHSHLLPGIDDGLEELDSSVRFIKDLQKMGYSKLICTPHILSDLYPNSPKTILPKLTLVREALQAAGVDIAIEAAAEYMIDHDFAELIGRSKKDDLMTINKEFILVEMSYLAPSPNFEGVIFDLRMMGLQPILAHPERYSYFHNNFEQYVRFKDLGCKLQVNLLSLSGAYGPHVKKTAEKLFKNGMVNFLGSDIHHDRHLEMLKNLHTRQDFYDIISNAELSNKALL